MLPIKSFFVETWKGHWLSVNSLQSTPSAWSETAWRLRRTRFIGEKIWRFCSCEMNTEKWIKNQFQFKISRRVIGKTFNESRTHHIKASFFSCFFIWVFKLKVVSRCLHLAFNVDFQIGFWDSSFPSLVIRVAKAKKNVQRKF